MTEAAPVDHSFDEYPDAAWGELRSLRKHCYKRLMGYGGYADRVLTLNLRRVFTLTQKLTPLLLKSHGRAEGPWSDPGECNLVSTRRYTTKYLTRVALSARIIMIGSVDGIRVPSLETYAYSASKAALHQMSRVLAGQLGKRGITCNTLACGECPVVVGFARHTWPFLLTPSSLTACRSVPVEE